ncbi:MAG: hypothetical protein SA378_03040 [Sedimentibacter sp.]|uniref:hypothetical protein n=1 Tax=Sedimentibacter sp. TaxID=1960295 RepID=UPI00298294EE|nr:hypothetical protein [Sedimentibacter sp.]MDW5299102.1 hypothetical protein [Sedimentibacter sp.]
MVFIKAVESIISVGRKINYGKNVCFVNNEVWSDILISTNNFVIAEHTDYLLEI